MDKDHVTRKLGDGNADHAARWLGISPAIYQQWPDVLSPVMVDRYYAAYLRRELARTLGLSPKAYFADFRNEHALEAIFERVSVALVMTGILPRIPADFAARHAGDAPPTSKPRRKRAQESAAAPA